MQHNLSPVFLMGLQRSGTNMTVGSLDTFREICLFNEGDPRAFTGFKLKPLNIIHKLLEETKAPHAKIALFKPISDTPKSLHWLNEMPYLKVLFCFRAYRDVVNSHAKTFGKGGAELLRSYLKNMLNEKTSEVARLYRNYEEFSCLHLLGQLYDESLDDNSIFALTWLFMNSLYFDFELDKHPRVLSVCYELTVKEPKKVFQHICSFLDIPSYSQVFKNIHMNSVNKEKNVVIDGEIEQECQLLYEKLHGDIEHRYQLSSGFLTSLMSMLNCRFISK